MSKPSDPSKARDKSVLVLPPLSPRAPMSWEIADLLQERILAGDFTPGQRLAEVPLSRQLQVSRGPVREALRRLKSEGLVHEEPNRGVWVAELTADDVRDICQVRAAIEGKAAQLLSARSRSEIQELEEVLDEIRMAGEEADAARSIELDLRFHDTLCRLSGNRRLHAAFRTNAPVLRTLFMMEQEAFQASVGDLAGKHEAVVDAIKRGDPADILQAIEEHMASAEHRLLDFVREAAPASSAV